MSRAPIPPPGAGQPARLIIELWQVLGKWVAFAKRHNNKNFSLQRRSRSQNQTGQARHRNPSSMTQPPGAAGVSRAKNYCGIAQNYCRAIVMPKRDNRQDPDFAKRNFCDDPAGEPGSFEPPRGQPGNLIRIAAAPGSPAGRPPAPAAPTFARHRQMLFFERAGKLMCPDWIIRPSGWRSRVNFRRTGARGRASRRVRNRNRPGSCCGGTDAKPSAKPRAKKKQELRSPSGLGAPLGKTGHLHPLRRARGERDRRGDFF